MFPIIASWDGPIGTWGFIDFAKLVIIVIAVCAVVYIAVTKGFGWTIPQWLIQICIIVAVAFVAIVAIVLLAKMM